MERSTMVKIAEGTFVVIVLIAFILLASTGGTIEVGEGEFALDVEREVKGPTAITLDNQNNYNTTQIKDLIYAQDNFDDNSINKHPMTGEPSYWGKDRGYVGRESPPITVYEMNQEIEIYAPKNNYALLKRYNSRDNIIAQLRIKISDENAGNLWAPGLVLYWDVGDWTRVSLNGVNQKISVTDMIQGVDTTINMSTIVFGVYYWVAIEITDSEIKTYYSSNGVEWETLYERPRPNHFLGAPPKIIIGKGYGGPDSYPVYDLNNMHAVSNTDYSYSYIDDFKVTVSKLDKELPILRRFPYPYKAGLTIASDIDGSRRHDFLEVHQFLNTKENTTQNVFNISNTDMGIGVGLEIADSFWMNSDRLLIENYTELYPNKTAGISYFDNVTSEKSVNADLIRTYFHAGYIDFMHSFGDFPQARFTRQMGLDALEEMEKAQINPLIFINHGDEGGGKDNIGHPFYPEVHGDDPASPYYHTDRSLHPNGPFRFLWKFYLLNESPEHYTLDIVTLGDGRKIYIFPRFSPYTKLNDPEGLMWRIKDLDYQLSPQILDTLIEKEGYMIVANHLGGGKVIPRFDEENQAALRDLASRYENGDIYVTTTAKLLWYTLVLYNLNWESIGNCNSELSINILNVADPVYGDFIPTIKDLQGITFYTECPLNTRVLLDGTDVTNEIIINPPDHKGIPSISFPLIHLPPLPEWTSDGYTRKTEDYLVDQYDYTISITNIDDTAYAPTLNYIGYHNFGIQEARSGNTYYIYIPDDKTIHLPELQPDETIDNIEIINGNYRGDLPRVLDNGGNNIQSAVYDSNNNEIYVKFNSASQVSFTIENTPRGVTTLIQKNIDGLDIGYIKIDGSVIEYEVIQLDGIEYVSFTSPEGDHEIEVQYVEIWCGDIITQNTILGNDLTECTGHGLVIGADNIVLDCNGHTIDANDPEDHTINDYGIYLSGRTGVTIKECNVEGFDAGIYLYNSDYVVIEDNTLSNNVYHGLQLSSSDYNTIRNNEANGNGNFGIYLDTFSSNNIITNNNANSNNYWGIVLSYSSYNNITGNKAENNNGGGIQLANSDYNTISENSFVGNEYYGAYVGGSTWINSDYNNFFQNKFVSNGQYNAYETSSTSNNEWNTGSAGNIWDDFGDNGGYPDYYIVHGPGNGVDYSPVFYDSDSDGFYIWQDCNDNNNRVNPGAREKCNTNYDDNCNGRINEGCSKPTRNIKKRF